MANIPQESSVLDPQIASIVKAIALVENGGKIGEAKKGQSGEMKSIFQFTPGTWRGYSREILGKEQPLNRDTEAAVVYGKVHKWLQEGYQPEEIASIWNSGKPDAYLRDHRGVNKYGVAFDTPGYVKKFKGYLDRESGASQELPQAKGAGLIGLPPASSQRVASPSPLPTATPVSQAGKAGKTLPELAMKQAKQVRQI